jgi:hypothetical protein
MKYRFMLLFILALVLTGCADNLAAHPTGVNLQAQANSPGNITPTGGPAMIGSDIGAFVTSYGQPNDHSAPNAGLYFFKRYPGSTIDFLIVTDDTGDGGVYADRAEDVTAQAPDTATGNGWTQEQAGMICGAFFPPDTVLKRRLQRIDGYDIIYYSASLALLFPTTAFTDADNNQVQAGLFDALYLYGAGTTIDSCEILIGTAHI